MITAVVVLLIYVLFTVENSLDVKEVFGTFYYKFIAVALAKVRGFEMLLIMYVYVENGTSRECAISTFYGSYMDLYTFLSLDVDATVSVSRRNLSFRSYGNTPIPIINTQFTTTRQKCGGNGTTTNYLVGCAGTRDGSNVSCYFRTLDFLIITNVGKCHTWIHACSGHWWTLLITSTIPCIVFGFMLVAVNVPCTACTNCSYTATDKK